jgi:hypothetical protein
MDNNMYVVIAESDSGLDCFGNPKGKPIIFEAIGEKMDKSSAIDFAKSVKASGNYGDVKVARLEICNYIV